MRRPWQIWLVFGLGLSVVLAAVGWISIEALRLDRAQAEARQQAVLEESVRLALWRMESTFAPLLAGESVRPYFVYSAFYPAERAYTRMFAEIKRGEVLLPSPLLADTSEYILVHFQFGPDGGLTSPSVPAGNMRDLGESRGYTTREKIEAAAGRLEKLKGLVSPKSLARRLPLEETAPASLATTMRRPAPAPAADQMSQVARNAGEWEARNRSLLNVAISQQTARAGQALPIAGVNEGLMQPVWMGSALVLARRVAVNGKEYVQGCWLDWPSVRVGLLAEIADLFPDADLQQAERQVGGDESRMLASLPVRFVPGELPLMPADGLSPIQLSLLIAWACVLAAAGAVAAVLAGIVSLSERRGA
ncbi:MAG: sensor histidine kinase, partial [Phycisphaerae bacterium]|nr:sensor histidine kinase [Phycisphaerae bacterium]